MFDLTKTCLATPGKLILLLKPMNQFQPITDDQSKVISSSNQDYLNQ